MIPAHNTIETFSFRTNVDEGEAIWFLGQLFVVKAAGEDTGGALAGGRAHTSASARRASGHGPMARTDADAGFEILGPPPF